jgi:phage minor structural protein
MSAPDAAVGAGASGVLPTIYRSNCFGTRLGVLRPLGAMTHTEHLCGEDTLEFECAEAPGKDEYLVWRDPDEGVWREHVVVRTDEPLGGPCRVYAEASWCELLCGFIEEKHLVELTPEQWLRAALEPTRWEVGDVYDRHTCGNGMFYHTNCLAALRRVESRWGMECRPELEVTGGGVTARRFHMQMATGSWKGLRFDYGRNIRSCKRTVMEDEVYTALYGYGPGLPISDDGGHLTGGYRRKMTFGSVNGGVNWVGNEEARERWGIPMVTSEGLKMTHRFGMYTNADASDEYGLLWWTKKRLAEVCEPRVSYEVSAALLSGGAFPGLGDEVAVTDASREPAWRLRARVVKRVRRIGEGDVRVTIGNFKPTACTAASDVAAGLAVASEAAGAACDAAVAINGNDLSEVGF